mgnify:FL=1
MDVASVVYTRVCTLSAAFPHVVLVKARVDDGRELCQLAHVLCRLRTNSQSALAPLTTRFGILTSAYSFGSPVNARWLCLATVGSRPASLTVRSVTSSNLLPCSTCSGLGLNGPSSFSASLANKASRVRCRTRDPSGDSASSRVSSSRRRSGGGMVVDDGYPPEESVRSSSVGVGGKREGEKLESGAR